MLYGYGSCYKEVLLGREVIGIDVSDNETSLRFRCTEGNVVWETEGDCCSQSWWADAFYLNELRGARVSKINDLDLPEPRDNRSRQEVDSVYGYELITDKGAAKVVFRNSSNGYYGGQAYLGFDKDHNWREITGNDWSA